MKRILNVTSLSHLIKLSEKGWDEEVEIIVAQPVYCLSLLKSFKWKNTSPGVLHVTDFTSCTNKGFPNHENLKLHFHINDENDETISNEMVFEICVSPNLMRVVEKELRSSDLNISNYDFDDPERCVVSKEGLFARVEFSIKEYNNQLEPTLISLTVINENNLDDIYPGGGHINNLISRYLDVASQRTLDYIAKHFPIRRFVERHGVEKRTCFKSRAHSIKSQDLNNSINTGHVPTGAELAFHQVSGASDTQAPLFIPDTIPQGSQYLHSIDNSNSNFDQFDEYVINRVSVRDLLHFPTDYEFAKKNYAFEVSCVVVGLLPSTAIAIKPYVRTLKIREFKIILAELDSNKHPAKFSLAESLILEFYTEKEVCDFLSTNEIEDVYEKLALIQKLLERLQKKNKPIEVRIRQSLRTLPGGLVMSYWTPITPLSSLTANEL